MGSVLIWAVVRSAAPKNNNLLTVLGCTAGFVVASLSYDYINHLDSQVPAIKE